MKQIIFQGQNKKHVSLVAMLLAASVVVLTGICLFIVFNPARFNSSRPAGQAIVPQQTAIVKHYSVAYPVFGVEKVDASLKRYAADQTDAFVAKLKDRKSDPRDKLTITYTVLHHGAQTATVAFHQQESLVGTPDVLSQHVMTFDLQAQKQLSLTDMLAPGSDARGLIATILHDYFKQTAPTAFSPTDFMNFKNVQLTNIQDFWLDNDNLVLSLNPHYLESNVATQTVAIKKELLASVMAPTYIAPDLDTHGTPALMPTYVVTTMPKHVIEIDPNGKMLALTFDDGPGPYTTRVLDSLKAASAHATFFVIGQQVAGYAAVEQRVIAEGNEIGNHSWNHADLTLLSPAGIAQQVNDTQLAIQAATGGYTPVLMRPPYGALNANVNGFLQSQGLREELWNVDTLDWLNRDANVVFGRIMASATDGTVILLHDIHPTSVEAAERAIPALVAAGYQLVTVSQLVQYRG